MTDNLRDRIEKTVEATIKRGTDCDYGPRCPSCLASHVADAVIRELGLEPQAHYDPDCDYYRYVTDWIDPRTHQRVDLP